VSGASLVSVVIPTLDAARFLDQALDSVEAQSHPDLEVLLIDGGSTDGTVEIGRRRRRVRIVGQTGSGLAAAWNDGIDAARGDLIAFLDSDDLWMPQKLTRQVEALEADLDAAYALARFRFVLEPGHPVPRGFLPAHLEGDHLSPLPSAVLARRDLFARIGTFDPRWVTASDVDFFARATNAELPFAVVDEVLVHKRVHDTNLSLFNGATVNRELLEVLQANVRRKRGTA
jgi:glycosyltransferase involved in cell wall biosynthesis